MNDHIKNKFINIVIEQEQMKSLDMEAIDKIAFDQYDCQGKHCFELSEAEVDKILDKDAYTSAQITEDRIEKMEAAGAPKNWGYFFVESDGIGFVSELKKLGVTHSSEEVEMEDWNNEWKANYKEIIISNELKVVPSWDKTENTENQIFIYPGMGFGTGTHETTFLCLTLFEDIKNEFSEGDLCLDFGCGSGILGIGAIKRKKMVVDFCDVDTHALENCHQNIILNEYEQYCEGHEIVLRDRIELKKYKLIFANILMDILQEEANSIGNSADETSFLILSGLLKEQEEEVLKSYQQFEKIKTIEKNGWIAILLRS